MKYRHLLAASLFITSGSLFANQTDKRPLPYQNPKLSVDERVEDLIKRMTLEEKVYQMSALRLGEGDEIFETSGNYSMDDIRRKFGNTEWAT